MKQVLAILRDSYHEAVARRSLIVMIVLATLPILFFASLRFDEASVQEAVELQAAEVADRLDIDSSPTKDASGELVQPPTTLSDVASVDDTPGPQGAWGPEVQGGWTLSFEGDLSEAVERRDRWLRSWERRSGESAPDTGRWPLFAREYFSARGFTSVQVQEAGETESSGTVAIALTAPSAKAVAGGHKLRLLWGAIDFPLTEASAGTVLVGMQSTMALGLVGFVGILLAIVLTAALIPNMLEKGTLDLALARPIGRTKLLLSKYVGGCWFVAILGTYAITGSWLALRIATGYGSPWVMIAIPSMIGAFAVLYSVSALVGVLTRSTLNSILAACGVWFLSSIIEAGRMIVSRFEQDLSPWIPQALNSVYWAFPKLGAFDALVVQTLTKAELPGGASFGNPAMKVDNLEWALGSNFIFAAVMLALAVFSFRRRDY